MKYEKGAIGLGGIIVLGVVVMLIGAIAFFVAAYVSAANYGNEAENGLKATWSNNQNILGQYTLKVQEIASVPEMYKNDLKEVLAAEMSGRYGKEGSRANMQWIKEHAVNFDSSMYAKIQQVIEAGRNEFQNAQTRLIDQKQVYETNLGYVWKGFWLKLAGYPKIDLSIYKPVIAGDTAKAFETGVQAPIKLR